MTFSSVSIVNFEHVIASWVLANENLTAVGKPRRVFRIALPEECLEL